jgi:hypothetical protein
MAARLGGRPVDDTDKNTNLNKKYPCGYFLFISVICGRRHLRLSRCPVFNRATESNFVCVL